MSALTKHPQLTLLRFAYNLVRRQTPDIQWTPSHPERRKQPRLFNHGDWGIYLADWFANPNHSTHPNGPSGRPLQLSILNVNISDLLHEVVAQSTLSWVYPSGLPVLTSLQSTYQSSRFASYLRHRDENTSHYDIWQTRSYSFAVRQLSYQRTFYSMCQISKLLFFKYWTGDIQYRATNDESVLSCPLCSCRIHSMAHILSHCPHEELVNIRKDVFACLQQYILNLSPRHSTATGILTSILYLLRHHPLSYYIWIGTWTSSLLLELRHRTRLLPFDKPLSSLVILRGCRIIGDGAKRLMYNSRILLLPPSSAAVSLPTVLTRKRPRVHPTDSFQLPITTFYHPTVLGPVSP